MYHVILLADIRLYREGLAHSLQNDGRVEVVSTAGDRARSLALLETVEPDLALIDVAMHDAERLMTDMRRLHPFMNVVALTVDNDERQILRYLELGAKGYVTREASLDELVEVLMSTARGELHCSPRVAACLMRRITHPEQDTLPAGMECLTAREGSIVELIERGLSNKEIARKLGIEVTTVKNHVHNILGKLQVKRRGEVAHAMSTRGGRGQFRPTL